MTLLPVNPGLVLAAVFGLAAVVATVAMVAWTFRKPVRF